MNGKSALELKELLMYRKKDRGGVTQIANRLGDPDVVPEWLLPTDKNLIPKSLCIMFPKPPKGPGQCERLIFFSSSSSIAINDLLHRIALMGIKSNFFFFRWELTLRKSSEQTRS